MPEKTSPLISSNDLRIDPVGRAFTIPSAWYTDDRARHTGIFSAHEGGAVQASLRITSGNLPTGFRRSHKTLLLMAVLLAIVSCTAQTSEPQAEYTMLYAKDNLVAWCFVPFDSENRDPAARAELLGELGINRMAWDWRMEHLPALAGEISVLRENGIELTAVWFWLDNRSSTGLLDHHEHILNTIAEEGGETTLWVSFDNDFFAGITDEEKVRKGAEVIGLFRSRAAESGTRVALYNHGDWFGEPENQIRIIEAIGTDDIGLVYNFHHAHHQIHNFPALVEMMLPWLWTVNLNGMRLEGPKIMDIGKGDHEAGMMRILKESGFSGTIGIIGHTEDEDVRNPLMRNLNGLKQILGEMGDAGALSTYH